ncbi:hypothetical protein NQ318_020083 [Aromia moschata]|uniref:CHK kinase-like domain-containing protein n=1 Tax=Aromia moschata TaxID=1265417 RepID=A0AAV8ZAJ0_9CUCU|nr:hypothetical protein NQ318_020083 [Aromia moschata]
MIDAVTPRCYLAREDKFMVLDNVSDEGFTVCDKHKFLDYDRVLVVLQSLAKLHASSIIYEEKRSSELGEHYRLTDDHEEEFEESFFNDRPDFVNAKGVEASVKGVVKEIDIFGFPHKLPSGKSFPEMAEKVCYKVYDLVKPSKRFRNVLCHGDLWATNFLLKYNINAQPTSGGCKFVDFQCGRYAPPAQDVLSVLYLTTGRGFRGEVHVPGDRDFMESCEEQKLFAIVQAAIYFPLILVGNDLVEAYFSDAELNEKALFEDRSYLVLAHMNKDESYTTRLKESIQDLKEYCDYL